MIRLIDCSNNSRYDEALKALRKSGIYRITNTVNGKFYVGSAVNILKRMHDHLVSLRHEKIKNHFHSVWKQVPNEAWTVEVLEFVEDKMNLLEREQYYLDTLQPWRRGVGYNNNPNAQGFHGRSHTEETRLKMRKPKPEGFDGGAEKRKGQKRTEETKLKLVKAWETRGVSEETKMRLREMGRVKLSSEYKAKRKHRKPVSIEESKDISIRMTKWHKDNPEKTKKNSKKGRYAYDAWIASLNSMELRAYFDRRAESIRKAYARKRDNKISITTSI